MPHAKHNSLLKLKKLIPNAADKNSEMLLSKALTNVLINFSLLLEHFFSTYRFSLDFPRHLLFLHPRLADP